MALQKNCLILLNLLYMPEIHIYHIHANKLYWFNATNKRLPVSHSHDNAICRCFFQHAMTLIHAQPSQSNIIYLQYLVSKPQASQRGRTIGTNIANKHSIVDRVQSQTTLAVFVFTKHHLPDGSRYGCFHQRLWLWWKRCYQVSNSTTRGDLEIKIVYFINHRLCRIKK